MTRTEMFNECLNYFNELAAKLSDTHEIVGSCNADSTLYLIPKGTIDQLTYQSKPANSYRFSDHWNWYANVNKCPNPRYIQCLNVDLPRAKNRIAEGKASKPIYAVCVAHIEEDGKYHHVFGEKYSKVLREWAFS